MFSEFQVQLIANLHFPPNQSENVGRKLSEVRQTNLKWLIRKFEISSGNGGTSLQCKDMFRITFGFVEEVKEKIS